MRGAAVVDCQGCRKFMYVRYASSPLGEIAIAGKSGRSVAGDARSPGVHDVPPFFDHSRCTRSFGPGCVSEGVGPCGHASRISSVAFVPNGAPFAIEMVGNDPPRAPAAPSKERPPCSGSGGPVVTIGVTTVAGRWNVLPPSDDRAMKIASEPDFESKPSQNT